MVGICSIAFAEPRLITSFEKLMLDGIFEVLVRLDCRESCLPAGVNREHSAQKRTKDAAH
jgi:hypothetical protein